MRRGVKLPGFAACTASKGVWAGGVQLWLRLARTHGPLGGGSGFSRDGGDHVRSDVATSLDGAASARDQTAKIMV